MYPPKVGAFLTCLPTGDHLCPTRSKVCFSLVIGALLLLAGCSDNKDDTQSARRQIARADTLRASKAVDECKQSLAKRQEKYRMHMAAKRFQDASDSLGSCPQLLNDVGLMAQKRDAEVHDFLARINDPRASDRSRADAVAALARAYPDAGAPFATLGEKLSQRADRTAAATEAARRRKEGVTIGMTEKEVLASLWGKPLHRNRTQTANHISEQWVYSGGYLYFTDGVLVTIQN